MFQSMTARYQRAAAVAPALALACALGAALAPPASALMTCTLNKDASNVPLFDRPGGDIVKNVDVAADWTSEHGVFAADKPDAADSDNSLWVRVKDAQGVTLGYLSVADGGVRCGG